MANIMVNDVCNLQCPYCFANKYVNGDTSTDISYGNFKKAVDWIVDSYSDEECARGEGRIALIGGEPTLHAQFPDLIQYAAMRRKPGQGVLVFTNGLFNPEYIDLFKKHRVNLLINLNSPEDIGEKRYEKVVNNIRQMRLKGVAVSVGINFYKGDMDIKFVLDLIEELSLDELRVGVTSPNTPEKIAKGPFAYFNEIKEPVIRLAEECAKRGCGIHFDCQRIPNCIMRDRVDYIRELSRMYDIPIDILGCSTCTPVLDISTDLKVVRCFGVSGRDIGVPMESFSREQDVWGYFNTNIDGVAKLIPADNRCIDCYDRNIGECQGGCIAFKMEKVKDIVKSSGTNFNRP